MSQKQKSEGEIKPLVLAEEAIENIPAPSQAEILLRVTSGIAAELIKAHDSAQSVSLNEVRAKISKKHGYGGVPRLVDIISAIPDDYKKALLPKLRARPIRTASGVCFCSCQSPAWHIIDIIGRLPWLQLCASLTDVRTSL